VADGASLAGWLSPSQARPTPVHGFTVQLVGYSSRDEGHVSQAALPLDSQHDAAVESGRLRRLISSNADVVGAVVMYDEPTEDVTRYAPYRLAVNGVFQPGG
jgi:hypothetical protein